MKVVAVGPPPRTQWLGPGTREYELHDSYWVEFEDSAGQVVKMTVPAGFVTDGPSVPDWLSSFMPTRGASFHASIFHDWPYSTGQIWWESQGYNRFDADDLFYAANRYLGTTVAPSFWGWLGVSLGGWTKY